MIKQDVIKDFVVTTLCCTCQDEVFRTIALEDDVLIIDNVPISFKIIIGNRLLLYFFSVHHLTSPEEQLKAIIEAAACERDKKRYNRARIVMIMNNGNATGTEVISLFNRLKGADEKVHFHMIPKEEIPRFMD